MIVTLTAAWGGVNNNAHAKAEKSFNKYITSEGFYLSVSTCLITAHLPGATGWMHWNRNKASDLLAYILKAWALISRTICLRTYQPVLEQGFAVTTEKVPLLILKLGPIWKAAYVEFKMNIQLALLRTLLTTRGTTYSEKTQRTAKSLVLVLALMQNIFTVLGRSMDLMSIFLHSFHLLQHRNYHSWTTDSKRYTDTTLQTSSAADAGSSMSLPELSSVLQRCS